MIRLSIREKLLRIAPWLWLKSTRGWPQLVAVAEAEKGGRCGCLSLQVSSVAEQLKDQIAA